MQHNRGFKDGVYYHLKGVVVYHMKEGLLGVWTKSYMGKTWEYIKIDL